MKQVICYFCVLVDLVCVSDQAKMKFILKIFLFIKLCCNYIFMVLKVTSVFHYGALKYVGCQLKMERHLSKYLFTSYTIQT